MGFAFRAVCRGVTKGLTVECVRKTFKGVVCGMSVGEGSNGVVHAGKQFYFCSEYCQKTFLTHPEHYVQRPVAEPAEAEIGRRRIVYFSMEVAADSQMPTYSGGLGV